MALAAAIVVAAASFSVLSAAGKTTETRVRGSVESNYRTAYDILVRPRRSALPLETQQGLVRNNYLSGLFGGITLREYEAIGRIPGVDVAAPVANIGFVIPSGSRGFRLNDVLNDDPVQLYRVRFATVAQAGRSRYPNSSAYIYYTRRNAFVPVNGPAGFGEVVESDAPPAEVCPPGVPIPGPPSPYWTRAHWRECYSARSPGVGMDFGNPGVLTAGVSLVFPILLAAIDPEQEARLLDLDGTVVSGRYLRGGEASRLLRTEGGGPAMYHRVVPVIASARTYVDERVEARIERLDVPAGTNVPRRLAAADSVAFLDGLRGELVGTRRITTDAMYQSALKGAFQGEVPKNISWSYWTASPVRYRPSANGKPLRPVPVENPLSVWRSASFPGGGVSYQRIPEANQDVQFRRLYPRIGSPYGNRYEVEGADVLETPVMEIVGRYDAEKLPGFSPLSAVPLETYYPPELLPGDEASRRALGGRPLRPSQNIGDYVAQPPLFLTTLEAMRPFLNPRRYAGASGKAPISVIRVRVKGVTGPDELSQARIRAVAAEIHDRTGLQVDITAGSSPRRLLVDLPAGRFGRPPLVLEEGWSKKGASLSFLQALDSKRLGLLTLILVTCAFFLANGAFAAVRGRRREIGTLLCLGWSRRAIFGVVLAELVLVGLAAGLVAAGVAGLVSAAASLDLSLVQTILVVPLSVGLATIAGLLPAWSAAHSVPLDAVRAAPPGRSGRHRVRQLWALALANVRRMPARTLVAAGGLAVACGALTLLLAINQAFQGRLVGTLLGDAISLRVRGLDFLVVGLVSLLAALSLADVLYLNLRERAAELVTLRTLGWSERHLRRVIATEAALVGAFGGLSGALLGVALGFSLDVPIWTLLVTGAASAAGGVFVALVASLVPLARLASLTVPSALAAE